jgi:hypothetical protein
MMSLKTIKYSQRLGDILRCLPAAKFLAEQGHEVFFVKAGHNQGEILDLEIWPDKYEAFIKSKKPWHDFVYSHPEIKGAKRTEIVLDLLDERPADGLPEKYHLIAPFGISQSHKHNPLEIIQMAAKELGKDNITVLCPPEVRIEGLKTYTAPTIEQLAKAVRGADEFWAINSAPIILASAVRHGKESKFWGEQGDSEVQNVFWFEGLFRMD